MSAEDPVLAVLRLDDLRARDACEEALECVALLCEEDGAITVRRSTLRPLVVLCHRWIGWLVVEGLCPSLVGASLDDANLDDANLDGARLDGAVLDGAVLDGAILARANLDGASLRGASLVGAVLVGASLDGAYRPEGGIPGWKPDASGRLRRAS